MTIKQMTAVSAVAVVTLSLFIVIQLFHFVQQRREDYAHLVIHKSATPYMPRVSGLK
ncbi:hypothetical protein ACWWJF_11365 [Symbiopectobacterium sp. Eva_TO]